MITNEVKIMSEIRSPHVVALYNSTMSKDNYYLAMELCNGSDLENFKRQRGGYLREEEARLILRQIVKGITAIKTKDVMHRDLKLPNIMLHFNDVERDSCTDKDFKLGDYIKDFNFAENHKSLQCKIADLGLARKLAED